MTFPTTSGRGAPESSVHKVVTVEIGAGQSNKKISFFRDRVSIDIPVADQSTAAVLPVAVADLGMSIAGLSLRPPFDGVDGARAIRRSSKGRVCRDDLSRFMPGRQ